MRLTDIFLLEIRMFVIVKRKIILVVISTSSSVLSKPPITCTYHMNEYCDGFGSVVDRFSRKDAYAHFWVLIKMGGPRTDTH